MLRLTTIALSCVIFTVAVSASETPAENVIHGLVLQPDGTSAVGVDVAMATHGNTRQLPAN
jgi:hypothetical protein